MTGGTLYHGIHQANRLSPTQFTICAFNIACGMQYLRSRNILHRDLKSLNVLLDSEERAHICDCGFSRTTEDDVLPFS
jgi:serine/threonine protein kinase